MATPNFPSWEISRFESAAVETCQRMNIDPWAPSDPMDGNSPPTWFSYAQRMAELRLMVEVMRNHGLAT